MTVTTECTYKYESEMPVLNACFRPVHWWIISEQPSEGSRCSSKALVQALRQGAYIAGAREEVQVLIRLGVAPLHRIC
jgi:hypothetical protein